jgi:hypothetical protein
VPRPVAGPVREDERERDRHHEREPHGHYAPFRLSHKFNIAGIGPALARESRRTRMPAALGGYFLSWPCW